MFVPEEHFASHRPKACPCPQQTLDIIKARSHNMPQRQQVLLVPQVPAIICRSDSPILVKFPLETWAVPHTGGDSSSHSPGNGSWSRTVQIAPANPFRQASKAGSNINLTYLILHPRQRKQQTWPLQGISRAPKDQGSIWFHLYTGQADVVNKQQLGIVSTCLKGKPDTKGPISQSCILSSMVIVHTSQLHLGAFSVATILSGKLFQIFFFNGLNSSFNFAT